jgi:F0F1-type ATP synthase membrane subunit c/vacuolar-type H+-ATPase subunit K
MSDDTRSTFYDLKNLNLALNRAKLRDALAAGFLVALCAVIAAVGTAVGAAQIASGTANGPRLFVLFAAVGGFLAILTIFLRRFHNKRRGGESLQITSTMIELTLPSQRRIQLVWEDPDLNFELQDFSGVDPAMMSSKTPYFLVAVGIQTALSREAFEAILAQVKDRRLQDRFGPASGWFAPTGMTTHAIGSSSADRNESHGIAG